MANDELIQLISSQTQSYHEMEAQSYRLFRILLAIGAISIGFTQSEIFSQVISLNIPSKTLELAGGGATATDFYTGYAVVHLIIAGSFGVIGGALLLDCVYWAAKVLDTPPMEPVYPGKDGAGIGVAIATDSIDRSDFAVWVEANQTSLRLARSRLRNSYESVGVAFLSLIFAGMCASATYLAAPMLLLGFDAAIVLFGILAPILILHDLKKQMTMPGDIREKARKIVFEMSEMNPTVPVAIIVGGIFLQVWFLSLYFGYLYATTFLI